MALILAVIVVLVLILAYAVEKRPTWGHVNYWKAHLTEGPDEILRRSSGGYDAAAALALRRSENGTTVADHSRAASIIVHNILAQNDQSIRQEDRRTWYGRAFDHIANALCEITPAYTAYSEAMRANELFDLGIVIEGGIPIDAAEVLDQAEYFVNNGAALGTPLPPGGVDYLVPIAALHDLGASVVQKNSDVIEARQAAAAEIAHGLPGTQTQAYLDLSKHHRNDMQNSHDPSVNVKKRAIVVRLRESQGDLARMPTLDQIAAELRLGSAHYSRDPRTGRERPLLTDRALEVVEMAKKGHHSSSTTATDEECLRRVWARADDPANAKNKDKMRQAAYDALVSSWDTALGDDEIQCVDGRISRMVGSLALLDHDETNWNVQRLEEHRNHIYEQTAEVIRLRAQKAVASPDQHVRSVGLTYLAKTADDLRAVGEIPEDVTARWEDGTRREIEKMIDGYVAGLDPGTIAEHTVDRIKKEAISAI